MAIEKVPLGVTTIKELLDNGYTWLEKDNLGFGSIQSKYEASDIQIASIRKHPLLKNLETTARIFIIIDDTKDETRSASLSGNGSDTEIPVDSTTSSNRAVSKETANADRTDNENSRRVYQSKDAENLIDDSFSAFANL